MVRVQLLLRSLQKLGMPALLSSTILDWGAGVWALARRHLVAFKSAAVGRGHPWDRLNTAMSEIIFVTILIHLLLLEFLLL